MLIMSLSFTDLLNSSVGTESASLKISTNNVSNNMQKYYDSTNII